MWDEIENLGDLERLQLVLEYMPDEELMQALERGKRRDDYTVRAMWNSILAGVVYQHPSIRAKTVVTLSLRLSWTMGRYIGRSFGLSEAVTLNKVSPKNQRSR